MAAAAAAAAWATAAADAEEPEDEGGHITGNVAFILPVILKGRWWSAPFWLKHTSFLWMELGPLFSPFLDILKNFRRIPDRLLSSAVSSWSDTKAQAEQQGKPSPFSV